MLLAAHAGGKRAGRIFRGPFHAAKPAGKIRRREAQPPIRRTGNLSSETAPCGGPAFALAGEVRIRRPDAWKRTAPVTPVPGDGGWERRCGVQAFSVGETDRKPDVRSDLEDGRRAWPGVGRWLRWRRCLAMPRREGVCGQGHRPSDHIGRHGQEACIDDAGGATLIVPGLRQATAPV